MHACEMPSNCGMVDSLPDSARRELWGWAALAVGSLAIAGVFALLLAISRIPGIETVLSWPVDFFHKGLVIHVVFSFVVWFLAVFGAVLVVGTNSSLSECERRPRLGMASVAASAVAVPMLFVPALLDRGEATLNNYVPTIVDPLYYAGLGVLAVGIAIAAVRSLLLVATGRARRGSATIAIGGGAVLYVIALICIFLALVFLGDEPAGHNFNEELFWGGGHVLQFLNTLLLLVAWSWLAEVSFGRPVVAPSIMVVATALLIVPALTAPVFYFVFEPFSATHAEAFTVLQYALAPPALVVVGAIALCRPRTGTLPWREPAFLCLVCSALVFAAGGILGLFVDGADTRTPAHYHGVIAGVTLAFMGLFYALFLPALSRAVNRGKMLYAQIYLFAGGQFLACIGLFLAGGFGTPRKTAGAEQGLEQIGALVGMAMNGVGGLVAVIGGVLFVWIAGKALLVPSRRFSAAREV